MHCSFAVEKWQAMWVIPAFGPFPRTTKIRAQRWWKQYKVGMSWVRLILHKRLGEIGWPVEVAGLRNIVSTSIENNRKRLTDQSHDGILA